MHTPLILMLILAAVVVFDAFYLVDLARAAEVQFLPKWAWAIIIVLISAPLGGIVYLAVGRSADRTARQDRLRAPELPSQPSSLSPPSTPSPHSTPSPQSPGKPPSAPARPGARPAVIEVSQLTPRHASLEDAYLDITRDSVEYRAGGPAGKGKVG